MVLLLFSLGDEQLALDTRLVVEVVPMVQLRPVYNAPEYVVGFFNYRGAVVPVVDLCQLTLSRPCQRRMSTRIILVEQPAGDGGQRLVGLLAERVTETVHQDSDGLAEGSSVLLQLSLELGEVRTANGDMLQCLRLDRLLPEGLDELVRDPETAEPALASAAAEPGRDTV